MHKQWAVLLTPAAFLVTLVIITACSTVDRKKAAGQFQATEYDQAYYPVAERIAICMGLASASSLPQDYLTALGPPFQNYNHIGPSIPPKTDLRIEFRAVSSLSSLIYQEKEFYFTEMNKDYVHLSRLHLTIIIVGFFTTVTITISSSKFGRSSGRCATFIRVVAIVLPALGTALGSANALYDPKDRFNSKAETLQNLVELQDKIGLGVWDLSCDAPDKTIISKWEDEHSKIISSSLILNGSSTGAEKNH